MTSAKRAARMAAWALLAAPAAWASVAVADGGWEITPAARLSESAAAAVDSFQRFVTGTASISPRFKDGAGVAAAVRQAASYEPQQFSEGMVLYAALAALQDPTFVEGARLHADRVGRRAMLDELAEDPLSAMLYDGAPDAAVKASLALQDQGERLLTGGKALKQASYDLQKQPWSTAFVPDAARLLAEVKRLGSAPAAGGLTRVADDGAPAGYGGTPRAASARVVHRALALAAAMAIGEQPDSPRLRPIAGDPSAGQCLRMAKLNYHQCLSAAGPHYEDVYCIAQHAMTETGGCLTKASR